MRDLVLNNCRLDGRYDIREKLGRGSYAEVFLASDTRASTASPHRMVVIKALNVFLQNDLDPDLERTLVENFQNEAISLDRVRHPNIISRLGHGTAKDLRGTVFHYLVLEYLPGGDLARQMRERRLSPQNALEYLEQICAGLAHAHRLGIIHRDIKPQNLLLTLDKRVVKIADFGVARSLGSESPITRVGTNIYAPPEHSPLAVGNTSELGIAELTPAADVYSLAKTTYTLLTGESPRHFANHPITELPIDSRNRRWSRDLSRVLGKATRNDPSERHQSVLEFWEELSALNELFDELDGRVVTAVASRRHTTPQAQIALGFSPNAPQKPAFDTSKKLKLESVLPTTPLSKPKVPPYEQKRNPLVLEPPVVATPEKILEPSPPVVEIPTTARGRGRRFLKAAGTLFMLLAVFAGSLLFTYNYLLGKPIFSGFSGTSVKTGTATTDINLRPAPNTSNRPIGMVTKGSKVEILQASNNWREVVIIKHGRPKSDPAYADKGWVYGSYISEE
ncbi:MAG: serine/threonine protein kinase [Pyrinomonadaceae bacterium]